MHQSKIQIMLLSKKAQSLQCTITATN